MRKLAWIIFLCLISRGFASPDGRDLEENSPPNQTYSDSTGTYNVTQIQGWVLGNKKEWFQAEVQPLLEYIAMDTWGDTNDKPSSNLKYYTEDTFHFKRVKEANLEFPIILTNNNHIIDGVHRLFKAVKSGSSTIMAVYIDNSLLQKYLVGEQKDIKTPLIFDSPFPEIYLNIPYVNLPDDEKERRIKIHTYFTDHLPSAEKKEDSWEITLERPSTPYGDYSYDSDLRKGLEWWGKGTRIRDIPRARKEYANGLLALEDQWCPLSWSRYFERSQEIPNELILLHIDDHKDMMMPRLGKRLDNKYVDYITGDHFSLLEPESVEKAISSGAIGKGSILTPLIWEVEKIHVRHLSCRSYPHKIFHIKKHRIENEIITKSKNRLAVHIQETNWEDITHSNYIVTNDPKEWARDLPQGIPIFLHIDMDYFNNRFDGNSNWEQENERSHEIDFNTQKEMMNQIGLSLKDQKISHEIKNITVALSPGFYPAEYWEKGTKYFLKELDRHCGIKFETEHNER